MKKKAELLKELGTYLKYRLDNDLDYIITIDEARALVEALEGLRWVAMYESDERNEIGRECIKFEDADYIGRLAEGVDYLETVGIIRLKDENDEN